MLGGIDLQIQLLNKNKDSIRSLQEFFRSNSDYFTLITGEGARDNEAEATFTECPPNRTPKDIIIFGLFIDNKLKGIVQFLQKYPNDKTIFLGLLLIDTKFRNKGFANKLFDHAEKFIIDMNNFNTIRLAVFEHNKVIPFWKKLGFKLTGEKKTIQDEHISGSAFIMEKALK